MLGDNKSQGAGFTKPLVNKYTLLGSFEATLCMQEILQKHRNGATARRGSFLPFDRMQREMEERDGTKMQQLHGNVRTTKLPKNYTLSYDRLRECRIMAPSGHHSRNLSQTLLHF